MQKNYTITDYTGLDVLNKIPFLSFILKVWIQNSIDFIQYLYVFNMPLTSGSFKSQYQVYLGSLTTALHSAWKISSLHGTEEQGQKQRRPTTYYNSAGETAWYGRAWAETTAADYVLQLSRRDCMVRKSRGRNDGSRLRTTTQRERLHGTEERAQKRWQLTMYYNSAGQTAWYGKAGAETMAADYVLQLSSRDCSTTQTDLHTVKNCLQKPNSTR